jgi:hypothetical protein
VKCFTEALQRHRPIRSALSSRQELLTRMGQPAMTKTLITTALALGLGLLSTPSFARSYIVNGHPASLTEAQHLVASGVQQGAWVVNGYGIAPAAERTSFTAPPESSGKKCFYVLDVLLCD